MDEQTKSIALDGSAFARVLRRLMEAHLPGAVDEEKALDLADWSGYDTEAFKARLAGDLEANVGDLSQLAYELDLDEHERLVLTVAYLYERDLEGSEPMAEEPAGDE
jgi:hypothetical protein